MAQRNVTAGRVTRFTAVKRVTAASVTHSLQKHCAVCGKEIPWRSKRQDAKTCSANCRKAMSRRKDKFKRECAKMHAAIRSVRSMFQQWPDLEEFMIDEIRGAIEM